MNSGFLPDNVIVDEAWRWVGTPYRHQASRIGVGADCLGLVRGVWRAVVGEEPEQPGPYTMDWAESGGDALLEAAMRHFTKCPDGAIEPGRLILFRWNAQFAAKHAGIAVGPQHFIHAYSGIGVVCSALVPAWRRKIAGVFAFPPVKSAALPQPEG
jgi:NlpC/P60 family putative phage cell wall peptidase